MLSLFELFTFRVKKQRCSWIFELNNINTQWREGWELSILSFFFFLVLDLNNVVDWIWI